LVDECFKPSEGKKCGGLPGSGTTETSGQNNKSSKVYEEFTKKDIKPRERIFENQLRDSLS
jgi:hypothetical protein